MKLPEVKIYIVDSLSFTGKVLRYAFIFLLIFASINTFPLFTNNSTSTVHAYPGPTPTSGNFTYNPAFQSNWIDSGPINVQTDRYGTGHCVAGWNSNNLGAYNGGQWTGATMGSVVTNASGQSVMYLSDGDDQRGDSYPAGCNQGNSIAGYNCNTGSCGGHQLTGRMTWDAASNTWKFMDTAAQIAKISYCTAGCVNPPLKFSIVDYNNSINPNTYDPQTGYATTMYGYKSTDSLGINAIDYQGFTVTFIPGPNIYFATGRIIANGDNVNPATLAYHGYFVALSYDGYNWYRYQNPTFVNTDFTSVTPYWDATTGRLRMFYTSDNSSGSNLISGYYNGPDWSIGNLANYNNYVIYGADPAQPWDWRGNMRVPTPAVHWGVGYNLFGPTVVNYGGTYYMAITYRDPSTGNHYIQFWTSSNTVNWAGLADLYATCENTYPTRGACALDASNHATVWGLQRPGQPTFYLSPDGVLGLYAPGGGTALHLFQKRLINPGNAPTATISAGGNYNAYTGSVNTPMTISATVADADGNLGGNAGNSNLAGAIYQWRDASNNANTFNTATAPASWALMNSVTDSNCSAAPNNRSSCTLTYSFTPTVAGTYMFVVNGYDSVGNKCTGNYFYSPFSTGVGNWQRCDGNRTQTGNNGARDYVIVTVTSDRAPLGSIVINSCNSLSGWAYDPDKTSQSIMVNIRLDGTRVAQNWLAGDPAPSPGGGIPGNHGFTWNIDDQYKDGLTHTVDMNVLGIDASGNQTGLNTIVAASSPASFTCLPDPWVNVSGSLSYSSNRFTSSINTLHFHNAANVPALKMPYLYWSFNNVTSNTQTINDDFNLGYTASQASTSILNNNGINGNSVQATGVSGSGIIMNSSPGLSSTGSFTYSFWVKPTSTPVSGALTDGNGTYYLDRPTATLGLVSVKSVGSKYALQTRYDTDLTPSDGYGLGGIAPTSSNSTIVQNTWAFIVVQRDSVAGLYRFYVNGVLEGVSTYTIARPSTPPAPMLGRSSASTTATNAIYDEFKIYNEVISSSQISYEYNTFKNGNSPLSTIKPFSDSPVLCGTVCGSNGVIGGVTNLFKTPDPSGLNRITSYGNMNINYNDTNKNAATYSSSALSQIMSTANSATKKCVDLALSGADTSCPAPAGMTLVNGGTPSVNISLAGLNDSVSGSSKKGITYQFKNTTARTINISYDLNDSTKKRGIILYFPNATAVNITYTTGATSSLGTGGNPGSTVMVITDGDINIKNLAGNNYYNLGLVSRGYINYLCPSYNSATETGFCKTYQNGTAFSMRNINVDYKNQDMTSEPALNIKYNPDYLLDFQTTFQDANISTANVVGLDY